MNFKSEIKFLYDALMKYSAFFGSFVFWIFAILFLLIINQSSFAVKFFMASLIGKALEYGVKIVYRTERPKYNKKTISLFERFHDLGSMPSGHSIMISLFTTMAYLQYNVPYLALLLIAASLLSGLSRIYLKRHYTKDVIVGYALGILLGYLFS